ncbi:MAG TPA: hypothetical protein RMI62_26175 [Polyangiaceae bacterium LLY-WYZ-15_(1-7)]|nr:hypothetical protein [Polyangiaceae bacterium LLY-WYZ-15_(1-7)]
MSVRGRTCRGGVIALAALLALVAARPARANPEPPANYDALVAAMGGAAVATANNPSALFHNPARLDQIERFAITAVATSLLVNLQAPFAGPGTEQESGLIYAPLLFLGGAGRVHERVVVGAGAYVYTGFGGGFRNVDCIANGDPVDCEAPDSPYRIDPPADQEVTLFVAEFAIPVQVKVHERVSLGVTLRLPWGRQDVRAHQDINNSNPDTPFLGQAEQTLSGFGIPGVLLGVNVEPIDGLHIGLAYRSKVWVNLDGTTTTPPLVPGADPLLVDTSTRWDVPHMLRLGVAYTTWRDRLTVTGEFKIQFHDEANEAQVFELDNPLAPDTRAEFRWKNVYFGNLAAELWALPRWPIRLGVTLARSASEPETLTPFSPPPGIQYGMYGGFGVLAGPLQVDMAFGWGGGPAYTRTENGALCVDADERTEGVGARRTLTAQGGCAGTYDVDSWFLSLSATFRLGAEEGGSESESGEP